MKSSIGLLFAALLLASCGVDGDPVRPTMSAGLGVSAGGGVHARGNVGMHQGPVSLYVGL
ncbi:hypothetical protein [Pontibaca salina]|uniref:Argininosuccinate lyase n=1 Tax=Pontibaca salina TaxID=2795731 RepID=A0A934HQI1_9RHOB|nr:hypothetical protein [Pontibaca salina]MBI6628725.1 hypothetical protein [Pontibaca salina]